MANKSYGKYEVPETLKKIIALQNELKERGKLQYGDLLGLYFAIEGLESRYLNTPLDVIPFARPGVDGIHFGFLTEFGQVRDLEEAYIVRVIPMDFDDPVQIVARNIRDFMTLLCCHPPALEVLDNNVSEEYYLKVAEEYPDITGGSQKDEVKELFQQTFQLQPLPDILDYYNTDRNERYKEIVVETEDGIGVVNRASETEEHKRFDLRRQEELQLSKIQPFFSSAGYESRLAFLRDAQSLGLLHENGEVKSFLVDQLILMGLEDEAERLSHSD
ncbi:hypothetical protein ACFFJY_13980 [Fictibacillus aquaticus]|uniref:Uncharacterized protein n=1 Tax=Fictibacillus aquaticus TaxID=2021314 RepID=A0A235FEG8_9BACL|nr:hypothetical protein [Fictibacillus aquaticus]OYD59327.1 hypothetical protein CGZ90_05400 [Fictibacillus aquaticus]